MKGRTHFVIPDTQCKPGVDLRHMLWIGDYIADKQPDVIVHLGDHHDMPSLSEYDRGKKKAEGRRYKHDIAAGNFALELLEQPLAELNDKRRKQRRAGHRLYRPEKHVTLGNHEQRIARHIDANAHLEGHIGYDDFNWIEHGWQVHDFLEVIDIDGVHYSHYFINPNNGRAMGGAIQLKLKNIGFSFVQGHVQTYDQAIKYLQNGRVLRGLVIGACYLHDEEYKGYQGNDHYRGCVLLHEVQAGNYRLMELSLEYLEERYREKYPDRDHSPIMYEA